MVGTRINTVRRVRTRQLRSPSRGIDRFPRSRLAVLPPSEFPVATAVFTPQASGFTLGTGVDPQFDHKLSVGRALPAETGAIVTIVTADRVTTVTARPQEHDRELEPADWHPQEGGHGDRPHRRHPPPPRRESLRERPSRQAHIHPMIYQYATLDPDGRARVPRSRWPSRRRPRRASPVAARPAPWPA